MKLDWITDPHLDHLREEGALISFLMKLHERDSDGLLVTGDLATSDTLYDFLGLLSGAYQRPIYFVLGNHDYYGTWRKETHKRVRAVSRACPKGILNWMVDVRVAMLSHDTAVVGHDGTYDARAGQVGAGFVMGDYLPGGITDLVAARALGPDHLFELLRGEARACAEHVKATVREAVRKGARRVIILTHVPPFHEASLFRGQPSSPASAPWYVNLTLGDALLELAAEWPAVSMEVLAGHTHGACVHQARPNLSVHVGSARYGRAPQFQRPVSV